MIEQIAQGFEQGRPNRRIPLGQTDQTGKHDSPPLFFRKRFPKPAAMLTDNLVSKFLGVLGPDGTA